MTRVGNNAFRMLHYAPSSAPTPAQVYILRGAWHEAGSDLRHQCEMPLAKERVPMWQMWEMSLVNIWANDLSNYIHWGSKYTPTCLRAAEKGRMAISALLLLGLLKKSRKACGREIRHAVKPTEEVMGNKLELAHQHEENSLVSFTACEWDENTSKETKSLQWCAMGQFYQQILYYFKHLPSCFL